MFFSEQKHNDGTFPLLNVQFFAGRGTFCILVDSVFVSRITKLTKTKTFKSYSLKAVSE